MEAEIKMNKKFLEFLQKQTKQAAIDIAKEFGVVAVKHFKDGFRGGGGKTDKGKWQPRKNNSEPERAILVKTGSLSRSIKIKSFSTSKVVIGTDSSINYADKLNFGTQNMPAREFLGKSEELKRKMQRVAERMLKDKIK
jgi:phage gpG-like protein